MRYIEKSKPGPKCLVAYPRGSTWKQVEIGCRDVLRRDLSVDQGGICCYCMRRLTDDAKVEHYRPQAAYPRLQTDWKNLRLACRGGEGSGPGDQTCDTRKGQRELSVDPLDQRISLQIVFNSLGEIDAVGSEEHRRELHDVLNLNAYVLVQDRKHVLDAFLERLKRRYGARSRWTAPVLMKELGALRQRRPLQPYTGFLEQWLESHIPKQR